MAAAFLWLMSPAAHAQNCKPADSVGEYKTGKRTDTDSSNETQTLTCDMTYYNTKVRCCVPSEDGKNDKCDLPYGTNPPCPKDPMPMKDTALKSPIKDLSPYLYAYARDPDDKTKPYTGFIYRGTQGDTTTTFDMVGGGGNNPNDQQKRLASCGDQLKFPGTASSTEDQAKMVRMQLDSCTNRYILQTAAGPYQKEDANLLSGENADDPSKLISLTTHCQPLEVKPPPVGSTNQPEYDAGWYLNEAWTKLLQTPSHRGTYPNGGLAAKDPPHLPDGVTLNSQLSPPNKLSSVTLSQIAAVKFEEINDPSHPYSPRWDFENNERDKYSPRTAAYGTDIKNSTYCAGVREDEDNKNNNDNSTGCLTPDQDGKTRSIVKVDILGYRNKPFDTGIMHRIVYNNTCFADQVEFEGPLPAIIAGSFCFDIISVWPLPGIGRHVPCWECFGLTKGEKVDYDSTYPPCATGYATNNGKDLKVKGHLPGALNGFSSIASCEVANGHKKDEEIPKLCRDLRAPYTPLNKLKMRYHNPKGDKDNDVLPEGTPEGTRFCEYFSDHMPYPRLWDVGTSIQKTQPSDMTDQKPTDYLGQWTAIVGVGREAEPTGSSSSGGNGSSSGSSGSSGSSSGGGDDEKHKDERCLLGGWGESTDVGGAHVSVPDALSSWTELKLYQTRTDREEHLSCIGRYEKVFKPGSTEGLALLGTGAEFTSAVIADCPKDSAQPCTWKTVKDLQNENGGSSGGGSSSSSGGNNDNKTMTNYKFEGVANGWRGYLSAKQSDQQFPKLGGGGSTQSGLDNAECGDIVMLPKGADGDDAHPGLPKVGIISGVNLPNKASCKSTQASNCASQKNCYVDVIEYDNGKFPDICGTTDHWKERKTVRFYKAGMLPADAKNEAQRIGWTTKCDDTKLSPCEMDKWDDLKLYRIKDDKRNGSDTMNQDDES